MDIGSFCQTLDGAFVDPPLLNMKTSTTKLSRASTILISLIFDETFVS